MQLLCLYSPISMQRLTLDFWELWVALAVLLFNEEFQPGCESPGNRVGVFYSGKRKLFSQFVITSISPHIEQHNFHNDQFFEIMRVLKHFFFSYFWEITLAK